MKHFTIHSEWDLFMARMWQDLTWKQRFFWKLYEAQLWWDEFWHKKIGTGEHIALGPVGSKTHTCLVCGKLVDNPEWKKERRIMRKLKK